MAQETWLVSGEKVIDVDGVRRLKVALVAGQINVVGHDEPTARIEVHSVGGRELKISGLTLTAVQREALFAELSSIPGLNDMKIEALVDGRWTVTKYQGGHEKFEIRSNGRPEHAGKPEKLSIERPGRALGHERIERLERLERPERPERPGRR